MTPRNGARLELAVLTAVLLGLSACGSSSDGAGPSTCAGCQGALCAGTCTDLSATMKDKIASALPRSACVPRQDIQLNTTACGGPGCGGALGCNVQLTWSSIALSRATHKLTGSLHATSNVDVVQNGVLSCTATVTADLAFEADAGFTCATGSESATFGAITTNLTGSSVSATCDLLPVIVAQFEPAFRSFVQNAAATGLAGVTTPSVTASCPP